jgi:molecular chaperone GrpE
MKKTDQTHELAAQVQQLKEQQLRAQADYQNLVRRNQEDRLKFIKMATADLMLSLLANFDHLETAAAQLKDPGLNLVVGQLQKTLQEYGLEEIKALNQPFDVKTMEAVEKKGAGNQVIEVQSKGYRLNGEILRHAKVVIG